MSAQPIVLKNFSGVPEIAPGAYELKREALAAAQAVSKVDNPEQQLTAVQALQKLKEVRDGIEKSRKLVKAPVLDLGRKIDSIAHEFAKEVDKQYMRLTGTIAHYQKVLQRAKAAEQDKIDSRETLAIELRKKAEVYHATGNEKEAQRLEAEAFDLEMSSELVVVPGAPPKPKGLVVKNKINFQVLDAVVFCQAYPQFWKWHEDTETLKLDRMGILDELNKEDGLFRRTRFPEELSQTEDRRLVQPAGLRIYEETKTHIR